MPLSTEQKAAWELQAYGCSAETFMQSIEDSISVTIARAHGDENELHRAYAMVAMSIMSDAQEEIANSQNWSREVAANVLNRARQKINQAKFIVSEKLAPRQEPKT